MANQFYFFLNYLVKSIDCFSCFEEVKGKHERNWMKASGVLEDYKRKPDHE